MTNDQLPRGLQRFVALGALLAGGCSNHSLPFTGLELSLAEMQAHYPAVAHPPAQWHVRSDELQGEQFELFGGEVIVGVFQIPRSAAADDARAALHLVAPTSRVKLAMSIDGGPVETSTFGPTVKADNSVYFDRSLHSSTISVELLEVNGVACARKAEFIVR